MRPKRWRGSALVALLTALQINAIANAQVSGEILVFDETLVSAAVSSLVAVAPGSGDPGPESPRRSLSEPRPVLLPQPVYPRAARAARQGGRVMVCFIVDEGGRVHTPVVRSSTDPVFDQPVLDAISTARFTPAKAGEKAVRSTACRTYRFELR